MQLAIASVPARLSGDSSGARHAQVRVLTARTLAQISFASRVSCTLYILFLVFQLDPLYS